MIEIRIGIRIGIRIEEFGVIRSKNSLFDRSQRTRYSSLKPYT
jgi:hypothetical protein